LQFLVVFTVVWVPGVRNYLRSINSAPEKGAARARKLYDCSGQQLLPMPAQLLAAAPNAYIYSGK